MTSQPESRPADESLRRQVEELAAAVVLGEPGGGWAGCLESVRREAERSGLESVARLAADALQALPAAAAGEAAEQTLAAGIARMQEALAAAESGGAPAPAASPLGQDRELVADFILESREHLATIEAQMLALEKDPQQAGAINAAFRGFHTIKGLAGFLELAEMREVAHETEAVLDLARNGTLRVTPEVADVVLAASDWLKSWLLRLEAEMGGAPERPAPDSRELLGRLRGAATERAAPEAGTPAPEAGGEAAASAVEARLVKVETGKLDYLVDMAGEMVIAQSLLSHHPELAGLRSPALQRSLSQLGRITAELQKTAMSMRMVPVGGLFARMSRLVRDLARKNGKLAGLETAGADTELDRNIVEELADPLMHMVRNAVDHGLEPPVEREAAGKPAEGRVRLAASHQAGHIVIEVSDDGRGLDRDRILDKARQRGLLDERAQPGESEIFAFIFHPGFSTAERVTDVSGRGVGMDVVRRQIQKLRGRVEIRSAPGRGTTFHLRLPLTLAIIDGLVVGVGGRRYIVPIFSVREMFRPRPDMVFTIEEKREAALVRGRLLPVARLHRAFGVTPRSPRAEESLLIVAEAGGRSFCLMVDELLGKQEVVIKSLGESLKNVAGVAGGAILGDGRVGLILDLEGVFGLVAG